MAIKRGNKTPRNLPYRNKGKLILLGMILKKLLGMQHSKY
jgi:hypothetical protein